MVQSQFLSGLSSTHNLPSVCKYTWISGYCQAQKAQIGQTIYFSALVRPELRIGSP